MNNRKVALLKKLRKRKEDNFIQKTKSNNRVTVAKYNALYDECEHLKKCMITLTPHDSKMSTLLEIRKEFARLIKRNKVRKKNGDSTLKYFTNIEFTKSLIPHIHIQLFFTNKTPILDAYNEMVSYCYNNTETNSISFAKNNKLRYTYVIKDYFTSNFDLNLEKWKAYYKNVKFYTSTKKSISNKITKYLYTQINECEDKHRYEQILESVSKGLVRIEKDKIDLKDIKKIEDSKNIKLVSFKIIEKKYIYVFEKKNKQKWAVKSKRLIKNRTPIRIRYCFNKEKNIPNPIKVKSRKKNRKKSISSLE